MSELAIRSGREDFCLRKRGVFRTGWMMKWEDSMITQASNKSILISHCAHVGIGKRSEKINSNRRGNPFSLKREQNDMDLRGEGKRCRTAARRTQRYAQWILIYSDLFLSTCVTLFPEDSQNIAKRLCKRRPASLTVVRTVEAREIPEKHDTEVVLTLLDSFGIFFDRCVGCCRATESLLE